jgi:hypothetical protein
MYSSLDLPLLSQSHMVDIVQAITPLSSTFSLEKESGLSKLMYVATKGHPRLQKSFLSVGSCFFHTPEDEDEKIPDDALHPFFVDGFIRMLEYQNDLRQLFPILTSTSTEVGKKQFPELDNKILLPGK